MPATAETRPLGIRCDARYRVVAEERILERLLLSGWAYQLRGGKDPAAAVAEARSALDRWIGLGLPFVSSGGKPRFDPAEVVNFFKWAGIHHGDAFWTERFLPSGRQLVWEFHDPDAATDRPPPSPNTLAPRRFAVTLRRAFHLTDLQVGRRIRLRLPLPLADDSLRDLTVTPLDGNIDTDFKAATGRLDAQVTVPPGRRVSLGVTLGFTAYPAAPNPRPLTAEETALYTKPNEGVIQVTPRVRALAAELTGTLRDPREIVQSFWSLLLDRLTCGVMHYDAFLATPPTDWILDSGWYDCHIGSALLIALCRARGIPARLVGGYQLYSVGPASHFWAEIWLDGEGWLPFDSICFNLSDKGRDMRWRDYFAGALDYRMKTQCLPRLFTGTPNLRFPPVWHILERPLPQGAETGFYDTETGAPIYRDEVSLSSPSTNAAPL